MIPPPAPSATPPPAPVRLVFPEGKTELSPADQEILRGLARAIPDPAGNSISILAYAAGKENDPSKARRLSLSRGMAVRTLLIESGIPSSQIYVRALGAVPTPDTPADRVELSVARIGAHTGAAAR